MARQPSPTLIIGPSNWLITLTPQSLSRFTVPLLPGPLPCPSRPAIDRRLKRSPGLKVHRRGVAAPGNADPKISPGSFVVQRPLDVVQIDHTPMDIVVVDDLYRQPLGKPYLTLATDVATRCILGFVISFVPPGAGTVSLCMTLIVSPKAAWLKLLGVAGD